MRRLLFASAALSACVQTTGGQIVDFPVAAAGAADLAPGEPLQITNDRGWHVVLTKARLHVGGVYLAQSAPVSGAQDTGCILPGTYIAQMTTGMEVDLLSPALQRFPALGHGTTGTAITGQVWLTGQSDVSQADDPTPILDLEGIADKGGDARPFTGTITIGANRQASGAAPICKQRIVSVLGDVSVRATGGLVLRVDARKLFTNVDFGSLARSGAGYALADAPNGDQASTNVYANLHAGSAAGSPYAFAWTD